MVQAVKPANKPFAPEPARRATEDVQAHRFALYELLEETERLLLQKVRAPSPGLLARSYHVVERIDPFLAEQLSGVVVSNRTLHEILFQAEARLIQDVHAHRVALCQVLAESVQLLRRNIELTPSRFWPAAAYLSSGWTQRWRVGWTTLE